MSCELCCHRIDENYDDYIELGGCTYHLDCLTEQPPCDFTAEEIEQMVDEYPDVPDVVRLANAFYDLKI